jgi:serine/alanine adding enzyme
LIVTDHNHIDVKSWSDFVINHPYGNFFQTPEYFTAYQNTKFCSSIVVALINDTTLKVEGILVGAIQRNYNGFLGKLTARCIVNGGPLLNGNSIHLLPVLLDAFDNLVSKKVIYTQFRNFWVFSESEKEQFRSHNYHFDDHLNIILELPDTEDLLWKQFVRSRQRGINKAKGMEFSFNNEYYESIINDFYQLLSSQYEKIGLPIPHISLFEELVKNAPSNVKFFVLRESDIPVIIMFAFVYHHTIYTFYNGIKQDVEFVKKRPSDLFFYEVMLWCMKNDIKFYDWMGAGKPGVEYGVRQFKLEYGGEAVNLGRFYKTNNPLLMKLGKSAMVLYKKMKTSKSQVEHKDAT